MAKRLKKVLRFTHLWLGLITGLLVFIIAITGCIYAFQEEIQNATQPYRFVEKQQAPFLPPSKIQEITDKALPGKHIHAVMYRDSTHAAKSIYFSFEDHYYYFVYVNQYTGEVLKVKDEYADFFRIVLDGHFYLWLPPEIGQPVVASSTLIFFVMVLSGIVLWWPKKKGDIAKKFTIKWRAGWRRKNYDLHSVLGFYASWIALIFIVTGLVWGFEWYRHGLYSLLSGGDQYVEYYEPASITKATATSPNAQLPIDRVWFKMVNEYPSAAWIEVHPPMDDQVAIAANANPDASTYWKTDYRYFDQRTLEDVPVDHIYNRFQEASNSELLMRMNYDIHVGAMWGLPGKLLAFFFSLMIASLPITGVVMWVGRRQKKKHERKDPFAERKRLKRMAPAV